MLGRVRSLLTAVIIAVASAALPAMAQGDDWLRLAPATTWNLDYAEDSCALRRLFGDEGQQVFLELRQYQPGEVIQVVVSSDDIRRRSSAYYRRTNPGVTVNFVPDSEPNNIGRPMGLEVEGFGEGYIGQIGILTASERQLDARLTIEQGIGLAISDERRAERESEISGLAVGNGFREDIILETGPMRAPMEAMRVCLDELLTHWGIDAEAQKGLLRRVRPLNMEDWAGELQRRYPSSMLSRGEQAIVNVRLTVDENGRPSSCAVQNSLNEPTFDQLACELLMEHSRFEPALDGDGEPIASYWMTRVIYIIG